jgi:hypothetical protein
MIGVLSKPQEILAVREFFELFKTPWEEFREGQDYDVVLTTGQHPAELQARLLLIYSSSATAMDLAQNLTLHRKPPQSRILFDEAPCPLYGGVAAFTSGSGETCLPLETGGASVCLQFYLGETKVFRLGYDLFSEVSLLLRQGQPAPNAPCPALDCHISILRWLILKAGLPLAEVPPVPAGAPFFACLTHDIDFLSLRKHLFDRTMLGFVLRASVGSVIAFLKGKIPFRRVLGNWLALLKLPLVHLRLCSDFWLPFERYSKADGRPATFFLIPFKRRDGQPPVGASSQGRAVQYDIQEIPHWVEFLHRHGCEVALHGIDAWHNAAAGREESRVHCASGGCRSGVRMHWLYFAPHSYKTLEDAGFEYDATCGYNEAVGYRAGTSQVFKPLEADTLLELPFQIQDTALFYPDRMNLSEKQARARCQPLIRNAVETGGVLTLSWHDRSLVPERNWGYFYGSLLKELEAARPHFATARQVVHWFRARRAITFSDVKVTTDHLEMNIRNICSDQQPGFVLRLSYMDACGRVSRQDTILRQGGRHTLALPGLGLLSSNRSFHPAEKVAGPTCN